MTAKDFIRAIENGEKDEELASLYGMETLDFQKKRYMELAARTESKGRDIFFFSTPGRTELGGNHTDHNNGKVLAGSITLDTLGVVTLTDNRKVGFTSEGFGERHVISIDDLHPLKSEEGKPESIVRGIAARLEEKRYRTGGFEALISSTIPIGGGLSSSASFEVLIATIFNSLYNAQAIGATELALDCQYAENVYFGKPCGLMDQLTCTLGGIVGIDFKNPEKPVFEKIEARFEEYGLALVILGTGSHHADLTHEYAAIPEEMRAVAHLFGSSSLREVDENRIPGSVGMIRDSVGDRALLRALHFFGDTSRVERQVSALAHKRIGEYLALVTESGNSSWKLLQNCYPSSSTRDQGICVALAFTEKFLEGKGAARVHGSGFGGAIQAYIPQNMLPAYKKLMDPIFGTGSVVPLSIRKKGTSAVF